MRFGMGKVPGVQIQSSGNVSQGVKPTLIQLFWYREDLTSSTSPWVPEQACLDHLMLLDPSPRRLADLW